MSSDVAFSNITGPNEDPRLSGLNLFKHPQCNATVIDYYLDSRFFKSLNLLYSEKSNKNEKKSF